MKVFLNGQLVDREDARITVFDHGLLYGDGVFEGIRSYNGLVFKLSEHLDRLYDSAKAIELQIPMTKKELENAVIDTLNGNNLRDAYIRLVITRGAGDLGLDPRKCKKATVFIITDRIVLYPREYYEKGLEIIIAKTCRNIKCALDPQIKSLNYLNNILAKIEAIKANAQEAIMLSNDGYVTECTGDNIFIVKKNVLLTPPESVGLLKGVTRHAVMNLAKAAGISVKGVMMKPKDLYSADECFLTGTAAEIVPVTKINDKTIGSGQPGKVTLKLLKAFQESTKVAGVKY
ncbi:MAG: branched-chain-amino-acid transaminase [Candidatus Omnitrophica bacterium]|nr:branched-chain-amino-acid transaminase [Candidatus Omnitrophota bacterium]